LPTFGLVLIPFLIAIDPAELAAVSRIVAILLAAFTVHMIRLGVTDIMAGAAG
jgi:small neutral amino acid transporter SnatA (MarC family)